MARRLPPLPREWAIRPEALDAIMARWESDADLPDDAPRADDARPYQVEHGVAWIPVRGVLMNSPDIWDALFGGAGTSYSTLAAQVREAAADSAVQAIVLRLDSPGGEVAGVHEAAEAIYAARAAKPIVAYTDGVMASAAYWLASAAHRIVATPSAVVGSIGIVATYIETGGRDEREGVRVHRIRSSATPRKALGPETEQGRADIQATVDRLADAFAASIARYRGVPTDGLMARYGAGRVFVGREALMVGLVDRITGPAEAWLVTGGPPPAGLAAVISAQEGAMTMMEACRACLAACKACVAACDAEVPEGKACIEACEACQRACEACIEADAAPGSDQAMACARACEASEAACQAYMDAGSAPAECEACIEACEACADACRGSESAEADASAIHRPGQGRAQQEVRTLAAKAQPVTDVQATAGPPPVADVVISPTALAELRARAAQVDNLNAQLATQARDLANAKREAAAATQLAADSQAGNTQLAVQVHELMEDKRLAARKAVLDKAAADGKVVPPTRAQWETKYDALGHDTVCELLALIPVGAARPVGMMGHGGLTVDAAEGVTDPHTLAAYAKRMAREWKCRTDEALDRIRGEQPAVFARAYPQGGVQ